MKMEGECTSETSAISPTYIGCKKPKKKRTPIIKHCERFKSVTKAKYNISVSVTCPILVVRVHGYRSEGTGSIPGATRFCEK
jgi:hypothetical protein